MDRINFGKCEIIATPLNKIKRHANASKKKPINEIIKGSTKINFCEHCGEKNALRRYKGNVFLGCYCERCFLGRKI